MTPRWDRLIGRRHRGLIAFFFGAASCFALTACGPRVPSEPTPRLTEMCRVSVKNGTTHVLSVRYSQSLSGMGGAFPEPVRPGSSVTLTAQCREGVLRVWGLRERGGRTIRQGSAEVRLVPGEVVEATLR